MVFFRIDTTLSESGPDAHHPVIRTLYDHLDVNTNEIG